MRKTMRWRFLQISLRTLFILVTIFAVWFGMTVNRARRQREAVRAIQDLQGAIHFDYQYDSVGKFKANAEASTPEWLRSAFGDDFFRRVLTVDFAYRSRFPRGDSNIGDEDLVHFESLPDIQTLEIGRNAITDEGLVHLRRIKELKTLYLYTTNVRGPGLAHLTHLPNLTTHV